MTKQFLAKQPLIEVSVSMSVCQSLRPSANYIEGTSLKGMIHLLVSTPTVL